MITATDVDERLIECERRVKSRNKTTQRAQQLEQGGRTISNNEEVDVKKRLIRSTKAELREEEEDRKSARIDDSDCDLSKLEAPLVC